MAIITIEHYRLTVAYKYIQRAVEHVTISAIYGLQRYTRGFLQLQNLLSFAKQDTLAKEYLISMQQFTMTLEYKINQPNISDYALDRWSYIYIIYLIYLES